MEKIIRLLSEAFKSASGAPVITWYTNLSENVAFWPQVSGTMRDTSHLQSISSLRRSWRLLLYSDQLNWFPLLSITSLRVLQTLSVVALVYDQLDLEFQQGILMFGWPTVSCDGHDMNSFDHYASGPKRHKNWSTINSLFYYIRHVRTTHVIRHISPLRPWW
jgi:hypothetical protein